MVDVMAAMDPMTALGMKRPRGGKSDSADGQGSSAALKILEPVRKKLATIETQRILVTIDESIRRHEILTSVLLIILPNDDKLNELSMALGMDITTAMKSHRTLNRLLDEGSAADESLRAQVCESCKNLLRMFAANPTATHAVRLELVNSDVQTPDFQNALKVIESLQELRGIMLEHLLTTPTEEKDRKTYLEKVSECEKKNAAIIEKLQSQLDAAIEDKEEETSKKNEVIRRLKNDLHQIEQFSEEHIRRTKTEADKQQAADIRGSEGKQQKLSTEIEQLKDQFTRMLTEHRENEQHLRKRKFKIETEVENWISKYDVDMGEKQDEYEKIDAEYTIEKKQLSELEEKFKVLEEEYDKIMEERRIAKEEKEARELELAHQMKAAVTIQAYFRAYKVRKALKNKSKKGGKGGKGKGKKKGKK